MAVFVRVDGVMEVSEFRGELDEVSSVVCGVSVEGYN